MAIFKSKKRTNKEIYKEMINEANSMMNDAFKSSGLSLLDLDEESGSMFGRMMESYKKIMDLAEEQAGIIDRIEDKLDALTEMNEKMLERINLNMVKSI